jgi:hypothetical protein
MASPYRRQGEIMRVNASLLILCLVLATAASAQDAKLLAEAKKTAKIQIFEMDELDTQGFADKRKDYRKIFFQ